MAERVGPLSFFLRDVSHAGGLRPTRMVRRIERDEEKWDRFSARIPLQLDERDEEEWDRFSARIPLSLEGIDHVYVFGSNRSENIVIWHAPPKTRPANCIGRPANRAAWF